MNSTQVTQFRIWATNVLRKHLVDGYTINEKRLKTAEHEFVIEFIPQFNISEKYVAGSGERCSAYKLSREPFGVSYLSIFIGLFFMI